MPKLLKENFLELCKKFGKPYSLRKKGIKKGIIDSILKGSMPKINEAYDVAKVLGVTMEELLTGKKGSENGTQFSISNEFGLLSNEEKKLLTMAMGVLRGSNKDNADALKSTIKALYKTHDYKADIKKQHNCAG